MKKTALLLALFALALPAAAGTPAVAFGFGHVWTGNGSGLYQVDTAQAQVWADFRFDLSPSFGIHAGATRDTVDLAAWGHAHNFNAPPPAFAVRYTALDLGAYYCPNPADRAQVRLGIDATLYHFHDADKAGLAAWASVDYNLGENWGLVATVRFRHAQDLPVAPVVNVVQTDLGIRYRF